MNIRLFSMAVLMSALPMTALAGSAAISLDRGDFIAAKRLTHNGETLVQVRLSKSGRAKFKKLNENSVNKEVHSEVAGVATDFKLREPIRGDRLQMGPYSAEEASKVINEINLK